MATQPCLVCGHQKLLIDHKYARQVAVSRSRVKSVETVLNSNEWDPTNSPTLYSRDWSGSMEPCSRSFAVVTPLLAVTRCGCLSVDSTSSSAPPVKNPPVIKHQPITFTKSLAPSWLSISTELLLMFTNKAPICDGDPCVATSPGSSFSFKVLLRFLVMKAHDMGQM